MNASCDEHTHCNIIYVYIYPYECTLFTAHEKTYKEGIELDLLRRVLEVLACVGVRPLFLAPTSSAVSMSLPPA